MVEGADCGVESVLSTSRCAGSTESVITTTDVDSEVFVGTDWVWSIVWWLKLFSYTDEDVEDPSMSQVESVARHRQFDGTVSNIVLLYVQTCSVNQLYLEEIDSGQDTSRQLSSVDPNCKD